MSRSVLDEFVLTLNKSWAPIGTCTVRTAFTHICAGTAKFLDSDTFAPHDFDTWAELPLRPNDSVVRTGRCEIRAPEVMILRYAKVPSRSIMAYSRRNLMKRDKYMCQYCGNKFHPKDLTEEHVIPASRGGPSYWTNCVAACKTCNSRKGDMTPEEAGMTLLVRPEMKLMHPREPNKWTQPYVPAWSPIFNVGPDRFKETWTGFVGEKATELVKLG
jgi:5-methylcytosine-specific restriction endonuclease McrA